MTGEKKAVDPTTEANQNLTEEQLKSTAGGWVFPNKIIMETPDDFVVSGKEKS